MKGGCMHLIDLHCDTASKLYEHPESSLARNDFSVDLEAFAALGSVAQVFALFINQEQDSGPADTAFAMLARIKKEVERNNAAIAVADTTSELRRNTAAGKHSALFAIEEGAAIEGSLETLARFYEQGVRFITLTWNYPNEIGFPHGEEHGYKGLTPFGLSVVEAMNRMGMIIDVSHLSDAGFWDVARHSAKPFMATHSNCRALCNHTRNLDDRQIRALADKGGVMGICVVKNFLLEGADEGRLAAMAAHIRHAENIGGIDVIAIGTDFDGTFTNEEVRRTDDLNKLAPLLKKAGYTEDALEKIFWKNALRVLDDVLVSSSA